MTESYINLWSAVAQIIPVILLALVLEFREFRRLWPTIAALGKIVEKRAKASPPRKPIARMTLRLMLATFPRLGVSFSVLHLLTATALIITEVSALYVMAYKQPLAYGWDLENPSTGILAVFLGFAIVVLSPMFFAVYAEWARRAERDYKRARKARRLKQRESRAKGSASLRPES